MRYHVTIRSRAYVIEVEGGSVTVDGEKFEAHAAAIPGTPLVHLLLGKDSWTVAYQQLDERRWALGAAGERFELDVQDDRSKQIEALTEVAWRNYHDYHKAPRRVRAGEGFADPGYELSVDWLATRRSASSRRTSSVCPG